MTRLPGSFRPLQTAWPRSPLAGGLALACLLALASLVIAILPEPQPRPVFGPSDVLVEQGFVRNDPPKDHEARKGIGASPWFATWRSWVPGQGSVPGKARSRAFAMPAYLAIPYQGFAGEPGIDLWLECQAGGARLRVATARTNTQWAEVLVARPDRWCEGLTRLVAQSSSRDHYLAFGTPFQVSGLSVWKARYAGLFGVGVLLFALVAGLCAAGAAALRRLSPGSDPIASGMITLGIFGYALFFLFDASTLLGRSVAAIGTGIALGGLLLLVRSQGRADAVAAWREPVAAWIVAAIAYGALLFVVDSGAGPWLANARFAPVRWSTDNQLPMLAGEYLARGDIRQLDLSPWLISDRTPLSYGLHAWLRSVSLLVTRGNDGPHLAWQLHSLAGIMINCAWVPVAWHLLRQIGLQARQRALLVATLCLLPFCLVNTVYVWPKLLAGAFALLGAWLLLDPGGRGLPAAGAGRWVQAALLSALALLSHGGALFGILAMLLIALVAQARSLRIDVLLRSGLAAAALLLPWMLWQRSVAPGGTALVKSVFGGTYAFDQREVGVVETIAHSYANIGLGDWLSMKLEGLRTLVLLPVDSTCGMGEMAPAAGTLEAWRIADFLALVPSLKFLWLGLLVLLVPAWRRQAPYLRPATGLLLFGLLGVAISWATAWSCQIIHTQSYQSVLAIAIGLLLLLPGSPRLLRRLVIGGTIAYTAATWIIQPLGSALRVDALAASAFVLALVLAGLLARHLPASSEERT